MQQLDVNFIARSQINKREYIDFELAVSSWDQRHFSVLDLKLPQTITETLNNVNIKDYRYVGKGIRFGKEKKSKRHIFYLDNASEDGI